MQTNQDVQNKGESFFLAAKDLGLFRSLKYHGFVKLKGFSITMVIFCLLSQVFAFDNLWRRMNSKWAGAILNCRKDVFYDTLINPTYDWLGLCIRLAVSFAKKLNRDAAHRSCFIIDDSVPERPRSKKVELLARIYDHVFHQQVKGFNLLMMSWTDGVSTIPVNFALMSSANSKKRITEARKDVDQRTHGAKRRKDAVKKKPYMVCGLVERAIKAGLYAEYVLMDTWFTNEPLLLSLRKLKVHVVGMVKQLKQQYFYNGFSYSLPKLYGIIKKRGIKSGNRDIIGSIIVETKNKLLVKIVFIVNRNIQHKYLAILSTDLELSDQEIVSLYARRFSIEGNFYNLKHHLRIKEESQCRSYDSCFAYTAPGIIRLQILEWIARGNTDGNTVGGLFYQVREEQLLMPLQQALNAILKFINAIPEILEKKGLIKSKDKDKAKAVLLSELKSEISMTSGYIQDFIEACTTSQLAASGALIATKINSGF